MGFFIYLQQQVVNDEFLAFQLSLSLGPDCLSNFLSNEIGAPHSVIVARRSSGS